MGSWGHGHDRLPNCPIRRIVGRMEVVRRDIHLIYVTIDQSISSITILHTCTIHVGMLIKGWDSCYSGYGNPCLVPGPLRYQRSGFESQWEQELLKPGLLVRK